MRVLIIYIEPAQYMLDQIRVLQKEYPEISLRIYFISASATQAWGAKLDDSVAELLPAGMLAAARKIFSDIRKGGFDWLHLAGWGHPLILFSIFVGSFFHRKISTISDTQLYSDIPFWKKCAKRGIYPRLFRLIDCFFVAGTRQKRYLEHFNVRDRKIHVVKFTVDVLFIMYLAELYKGKKAEIRRSLGLDLTHVIFVYVGRLEPYKGIELLLESFRRMRSINARLLIVGDGSAKVRVEDAVKRDVRIVYIGRNEFAGVIEALSISDVAIVPSFVDSWGLVVNEAMAVGLPVIVSDRVGCVDDLVIDNITGIIFPSGDSDQLMHAIQKLTNSKNLRNRLGSNALRLIQSWSKEEEAARLMSGWRNQLSA